jgi:leucyl/phenylalanyl-tRNA--protein transferase
MGYAHSFEAWQDGQMVGGLYGVALGRIFFGESMFHTVTDASKISLMFLVEWLLANGFLMLDCQFITSHLAQFGAKTMSQKRFVSQLPKWLSSND